VFSHFEQDRIMRQLSALLISLSVTACGLAGLDNGYNAATVRAPEYQTPDTPPTPVSRVVDVDCHASIRSLAWPVTIAMERSHRLPDGKVNFRGDHSYGAHAYNLRAAWDPGTNSLDMDVSHVTYGSLGAGNVQLPPEPQVSDYYELSVNGHHPDGTTDTNWRLVLGCTAKYNVPTTIFRFSSFADAVTPYFSTRENCLTAKVRLESALTTLGATRILSSQCVAGTFGQVYEADITYRAPTMVTGHAYTVPGQEFDDYSACDSAVNPAVQDRRATDPAIVAGYCRVGYDGLPPIEMRLIKKQGCAERQ
jgi:hypothetical protein